MNKIPIIMTILLIAVLVYIVKDSMNTYREDAIFIETATRVLEEI